ncbi:MAG: hypothetical protein ACRC4M_02740, partial [Mycoplasma sp.]
KEQIKSRENYVNSLSKTNENFQNEITNVEIPTEEKSTKEIKKESFLSKIVKKTLITTGEMLNISQDIIDEILVDFSEEKVQEALDFFKNNKDIIKFFGKEVMSLFGPKNWTSQERRDFLDDVFNKYKGFISGLDSSEILSEKDFEDNFIINDSFIKNFPSDSTLPFQQYVDLIEQNRNNSHIEKTFISSVLTRPIVKIILNEQKDKLHGLDLTEPLISILYYLNNILISLMPEEIINLNNKILDNPKEQLIPTQEDELQPSFDSIIPKPNSKPLKQKPKSFSIN